MFWEVLDNVHYCSMYLPQPSDLLPREIYGLYYFRVI